MYNLKEDLPILVDVLVGDQGKWQGTIDELLETLDMPMDVLTRRQMGKDIKVLRQHGFDVAKKAREIKGKSVMTYSITKTDTVGKRNKSGAMDLTPYEAMQDRLQAGDVVSKQGRFYLIVNVAVSDSVYNVVMLKEQDGDDMIRVADGAYTNPALISYMFAQDVNERVYTIPADALHEVTKHIRALWGMGEPEVVVKEVPVEVIKYVEKPVETPVQPQMDMSAWQNMMQQMPMQGGMMMPVMMMPMPFVMPMMMQQETQK